MEERFKRIGKEEWEKSWRGQEKMRRWGRGVGEKLKQARDDEVDGSSTEYR